MWTWAQFQANIWNWVRQQVPETRFGNAASSGLKYFCTADGGEYSGLKVETVSSEVRSGDCILRDCGSFVSNAHHFWRNMLPILIGHYPSRRHS
jgi:hypothetical protein